MEFYGMDKGPYQKKNATYMSIPQKLLKLKKLSSNRYLPKNGILWYGQRSLSKKKRHI